MSMNYRRVPESVLRRNPELYYNYLYPGANKASMNDNNPIKESMEILEDPTNIPLPNEENKEIEEESSKIDEKQEERMESKKEYSEHRYYTGLSIEVIVIVILILIFIIQPYF